MAAESSNTYGQEEATPKQLWALRCATGIDYRGRGLTKAEASEMIKESRRKAGEHNIIPSTEEATPRQLKYLKRHTGIDYSSEGLTKWEASQKIQECIENEEGNLFANNSTRPTHRETCEPAPEPGSLEYILSKCKTREEQLAAARKFFGEE